MQKILIICISLIAGTSYSMEAPAGLASKSARTNETFLLRKAIKLAKEGRLDEAIDLICVSAKSGNSEALYTLGKLLRKKSLEIVDTDPRKSSQLVYEAMDVFNKAAIQNHARAQYEMGIFYLDRCNVAPNSQERRVSFSLAYVWLRSAARLGHIGAQKILQDKPVENQN